ncbi:hypothetical protein AX16_008707 [Volvariella volvacea WC 439]|nr:hypothetical protein AX16_008707 [Volvariella volvacea WC 439]
MKNNTGSSQTHSTPSVSTDAAVPISALAHSPPKYPPLPIARKIYLKVVIGGIFLIILAIFSVFSIYWGALWKIPAHSLSGLVVDYDNGQIGTLVTEELARLSDGRIAWRIEPASDHPGGIEQLMDDVLKDRIWVVVAVNPNASEALEASLNTPDPSYNGSGAITVLASEARNENAFRSITRPTVQAQLQTISYQFARTLARSLASNPNVNVTNVMAVSPQTIVEPISYSLNNLRPFDVPVALAVTFVGLIYLLILSFFLVMIANTAREASGLAHTLSTRNLIILRLGTAFIGYFFLSLFYSLLSVAFQLPLTRWFGKAGFMIFWMLNWIGMASVGLALESVFTLLTPRFIPFFMILWIIVNVSVSFLPIDILPSIYRYGNAAPFYLVGRGIRTIVFGTNNTLSLDFGILIVWIVISCITLPIFQILVRRRERSRPKEQPQAQAKAIVSPGAGVNMNGQPPIAPLPASDPLSYPPTSRTKRASLRIPDQRSLASPISPASTSSKGHGHLYDDGGEVERHMGGVDELEKDVGVEMERMGSGRGHGDERGRAGGDVDGDA